MIHAPLSQLNAAPKLQCWSLGNINIRPTLTVLLQHCQTYQQSQSAAAPATIGDWSPLIVSGICLQLMQLTLGTTFLPGYVVLQSTKTNHGYLL